jgi:hypothetical protein
MCVVGADSGSGLSRVPAQRPNLSPCFEAWGPTQLAYARASASIGMAFMVSKKNTSWRHRKPPATLWCWSYPGLVDSEPFSDHAA